MNKGRPNVEFIMTKLHLAPQPNFIYFLCEVATFSQALCIDEPFIVACQRVAFLFRHPVALTWRNNFRKKKSLRLLISSDNNQLDPVFALRRPQKMEEPDYAYSVLKHSEKYAVITF